MLGMERRGLGMPGQRGQRRDDLPRAAGRMTLLGSARVTVARGAGDTDPRYVTRGVRVL